MVRALKGKGQILEFSNSFAAICIKKILKLMHVNKYSLTMRAQYKRNSVKKDPAISLVVFLGKTLTGMPPYPCGRQTAGPRNLPIAMTYYNERQHVEHELIRKNEKKQTKKKPK